MLNSHITIDIRVLNTLTNFFNTYVNYSNNYHNFMVEDNLKTVYHYNICVNSLLWISIGEYTHVNRDVYRYDELYYQQTNYSGHLIVVKEFMHCKYTKTDGRFELALLIKNGKLVGYEILSLPIKNYNKLEIDLFND